LSQWPQTNGARLVRALLRVGFIQLRQVGSHVTLRHRDDPSRRATIPVHQGRDLPPGTLRAILKGAQVDVDELRELL
jgi:predicted RNA binding protein YcfA (HicA-like mRNA interferase family)